MQQILFLPFLLLSKKLLFNFDKKFLSFFGFVFFQCLTLTHHPFVEC